MSADTPSHPKNEHHCSHCTAEQKRQIVRAEGTQNPNRLLVLDDDLL